jgi:hypothetical protein
MFYGIFSVEFRQHSFELPFNKVENMAGPHWREKIMKMNNFFYYLPQKYQLCPEL